MNTPMRISCTTLESFRLFCQPDQAWMTEAHLLATIRGEFTPTREVLIGQAFGACLELPWRYRVTGGYTVTPRGGTEAYVFPDAMMAGPLALMDHQHGVFEAKTTKRYGDGIVVSMADQIVGASLKEHKTTFSTFDATKYLDSVQWRFMADMFEAVDVTYLVFQLGEDRKGNLFLKETHTLPVYPYSAMHAECDALVRSFIDYVRGRGIDGLLYQRQLDAEAA